MKPRTFYERMGGHTGWLLVVLCVLFMPCTALAQKHKIIKRSAPKSTVANKDTPKKPSTTGKSKAGTKKSSTISATERKLILNNLINNMVFIDGGTFTMGATSERGNAAFDYEKAHQVTLSSFRICKYEVTQREWRAVMGSNPSKFKGENRPVENVSWDDCQQFISKLNQLTGNHFRLPTEAEWEYAARGGNRSRGYKYSGSFSIDKVAWYAGNSSRSTHNVGTRQPNELSLYDMSGNVDEWCQDWCGNYSSSAQINPVGPSSGSLRVFRGGNWFSGDDKRCTVFDHCGGSPSIRSFDLGLRLAL